MNKIGIITSVRKEEVIIDYCLDESHLGRKIFSINDLLPNINNSGEIVILDEDNCRVLSKEDLSKLNSDKLLFNLSILIKLEYNNYLKYINIEKAMSEKGIEKSYKFSNSGEFKHGSLEIIRTCSSVNKLMLILRELGVLETTLKLVGLEEKEPGIDYIDSKGLKRFEELNLQCIAKEKLSIFQKIKEKFQRRS